MRSWRLGSGSDPAAVFVAADFVLAAAFVAVGLVASLVSVSFASVGFAGSPSFGCSLVFASEAVGFLVPVPRERPGNETFGRRTRGARKSGILARPRDPRPRRIPRPVT